MHLIHICTAENSVGCWQSYNCNVTGSFYHTKVKVVHKWMFGMLLILLMLMLLNKLRMHNSVWKTCSDLSVLEFEKKSVALYFLENF